MKAVAEVVYEPEEAARRLAGISLELLKRLIKEGNYDFTPLQPGATPWGRGRKVWGLSDSQIAAIIAGQARKMGRPEPAKAEERPAFTLPGHDGRSRLRRKGAKAK